ncbi:MAG: SAM-dependent methyltransferase [Clostridia bacterium]
MKLNVTYYQSQPEILKKEEEDMIEKYINQYQEVEYEKKIKNKIGTKKIRHLTTITQNIVNWYPFHKEATLLEIGGNFGELTGMLCKKVKQVITIENKLEKAKAIAKRNEKVENLEIIVGELQDICLNQRFDYITLIGSLPYVAKASGKTSQELLIDLQKLLKEDGKLLLAVDNRFGIKYFVGNPEPYLEKKFVGLLNYNNEEEKIETYTRQKLIDILDKAGFSSKHFYYPLPDYRMPNVIFSDLELPQYNTIDKYTPYYTEKSDILVDEIDLFREILKTDNTLFTFFTNAYFVEASKQESPFSYKYISYNNMRKPAYRLITKIGKEYVEKETVDENAVEHYEQIKENITCLQKANIQTLDSVENGKIKSKYIAQSYLLSAVLAKKLEEQQIEDFYHIVDAYYEKVKQSSPKMKEGQTTIFEKYKIEITQQQKKELYFLEKGLWDMTFKNCFYIDNEYYFFDQEWKDENLPAEYILYRAIVYTISLRRFINIQEILEKYQLTSYIEIFKQLDEKMQEKIRDEGIWKYYNQNRFFNIDATKQELINMTIRSKAKDDAIEGMQKQLEELTSSKLTLRLRKKISKWIKGVH